MIETRQVSGGLFTFLTGPIGAMMGFAIGSMGDAGCASLNLKSNVKVSGALLGGGIAAIARFSPILATDGTGMRVTGIVQNAISIIGQRKAA